jgi:TolB-like protein/Flp pilus assembly protein TadD
MALYQAIRRAPPTGCNSSPHPGTPQPADDPEPPPANAASSALPLLRRRALAPDRGASIAVLPLSVIGSDPACAQIAEGIVEDLIEVLSRVPALFVVSRLSTMAFRDCSRHPNEIGETLGVRYVISGSFRALGDRVRIIVELTDTQLGQVLWTSRFDETATDVFDLQDRISENAARRIAPSLHEFELKRIRAKRPETLKAYDLFLRALDSMHNSSREVFETAHNLFQAAIAHDESYALAFAWLAYWHVLRVGQGWSPAPELDASDAERCAARAVECDSMEPMALAVHGHAASYLRKDFELAFRSFDQALSINPNSAPAWLWNAAANAWMGNGATAIEQAHRAIALTPYDPLMYAYNGIAGVAYLVDGQYERAIDFGLRCTNANRTYASGYRLLAMAMILAGREAEARAIVRKLMTLEPSLTVTGFCKRYPGSGSTHAAVFCDALARAGVPLSEPETNDARPPVNGWPSVGVHTQKEMTCKFSQAEAAGPAGPAARVGPASAAS